jgi:hypothetical protein
VAPEPAGLLPYSQEPATGSYLEPTGSTLHSTKPISLRSILSSSSHLCLGLSSGLFPSGFTIKPHAYHMSRPPHSLWFDLPNIWGWVQNMKLIIVHLPPFSCYFVPLWSKYSIIRLGLTLWITTTGLITVTSLCCAGMTLACRFLYHRRNVTDRQTDMNKSVRCP